NRGGSGCNARNSGVVRRRNEHAFASGKEAKIRFPNRAGPDKVTGVGWQYIAAPEKMPLQTEFASTCPPYRPPLNSLARRQCLQSALLGTPCRVLWNRVEHGCSIIRNRSNIFDREPLNSGVALAPGDKTSSSGLERRCR